MSDIKNKRHILATIDHLRSRKSRPDISRICKYMLSCYKISFKETKADLRRCVQEKSIYKVDYKDNVSYRNAERRKEDRRKSRNRKMSVGGTERRIITTAIASLVYKNQGYLENGLPLDVLVEASVGFTNNFSSKQLEDIIHKEIKMGSLVKLPNGNIALGPADNDADSCDSSKFENTNNKMVSSTNSSARSSPVRMRGRPRKQGNGASSSTPTSSNNSSTVRVGERRKMAKKVFDPSDVTLPHKRKRGRPAGSLNKSTIKKRMFMENSNRDSMPRSESQASNEGSSEAEPETYLSNESSGGVCSVCLVQKSKGSSERMVECRDCNNKAHLSCLQSGSGILKLHPDSTWQCPHCKTCVVCCETNDAGVLTVCSICADAYHALCHNPRIPENKKGWDQWECHNCEDSRQKMSDSPGIMPRESIQDTNKNEPFLMPHEIERSDSKLKSEAPIDLSIPDITYWSSNDVYDYFMEHLPNVAPVLKEQEMDGRALALAGRKDIVRGLGLQLGPALALYRIVVKLQTRKDDWTMCWG